MHFFRANAPVEESLAGDIEKPRVPVKRSWPLCALQALDTAPAKRQRSAQTDSKRGGSFLEFHPTKSVRVKRFSLFPLAFAALSLLAQALPAQAQQPGQIATYVVSIGGINVSNISIRLGFEGSGYQLDLSADVAGLGQIVAQGSGSVNSGGTVTATGLQSNRFYLETRSQGERFTLATTYSNGNAAPGTVNPPLAESADRVAVAAGHRSGVNDPLAAFILRGQNLDGSLCNRTLKIYTGIERFDMPMQFAEMQEATSTRTAYQGPVVLCAMRYNPVSGHFRSSEITNYLANSDRMLIWYMPLGNSGFYIPYRVLMGSSFGDISMVLVGLS